MTCTPDTVSNIASSTDVLAHLSATIKSRVGGDPASSYVAKLLYKGQDAILKKIGEEATELVMASKDGLSDNIVYECADVWFHTAVLLQHHGLSMLDVIKELARREGLSGLVEKSARSDT
jgi:phosphoribosyl-ATP pyrophosphohydrolase